LKAVAIGSTWGGLVDPLSCSRRTDLGRDDAPGPGPLPLALVEPGHLEVLSASLSRPPVAPSLRHSSEHVLCHGAVRVGSNLPRHSVHRRPCWCWSCPAVADPRPESELPMDPVTATQWIRSSPPLKLLRQLQVYRDQEHPAQGPRSRALAGRGPARPWGAGEAAICPRHQGTAATTPDSATSPRSTVGTPRSSEPPAADPQPAAELSASLVSEPAQPSPPAGGPAPRAESGDHPHDASPEPEGDQDDREALVDLPWLIAKGYRRYQPRPRDGRLRVTLASVSDSESASRWTGEKKRADRRDCAVVLAE
jgi:hypothetical protein